MKERKDGGVDLGAYLDEKVYPALYARLDVAFPEFGWVKRGKGWNATKWPSSFQVDAETKTPARLWVYANRPHAVLVMGRNGQAQRLINLAAGVSDLRGADFVEAVRKVCDLAKVPFPEREWTPEQRERHRLRELREDVLEVAAAWCREAITPTVEAYFAKRGLNRESVEALGLGFYASASALREHLRERGFDPKAIEESGAVFTRLEGYAVFPWRDERGRLITLYGRAVPGCVAEGAPKMMGLPGEGSKRSPLFMDEVVSERLTELVLVEGLFDAAVLRSLGDRRVACYAGGQLSGEQLDAIARQRFLAVYVCGDADKGGDAGSLDMARKLRALDVPAFIAPRLPDGMDPDTFVLERGIGEWQRHINESMRAARFLALNAVSGVRRDSPEAERERAVHRCVALMESAHGPTAPLDLEDIAEVVSEATGYSAEAIERIEEARNTQQRRERLAVERRSAIPTAARELADGGRDIEAVAVELTERLVELSGGDVRIPPYSTESMLDAIRDAPDGIGGGFGDMDEVASFRPGELALVAARPGHGKTSVLTHLLHQWAMVDWKRVVFVSFEEKASDIFSRLVARMCVESNPATSWTTNLVREYIKRPEGDWPADIEEVEAAIHLHREHEHLIDVVYAPHLTAGDIEGVVRGRWERGGVETGAVLVDYAQRIPVHRDATRERRDRQVSLALQSLKVASVRLGIPFVAGAQINRESVPANHNHELQRLATENASRVELENVIRRSRPQLNHLREGGLEQEADLVLGFVNYAADMPDDSEPTDRLDIGTLKNRYGRAGVWKELAFDGGRSYISEPHITTGGGR